MIKRLLKLRLTYQLVLILVFFVALRLLLPGKGLAPEQIPLFTAITFLFSIHIGFSLNNTRAKYNSVFEVDRGEGSLLYIIYMYSKRFSPKDAQAIHQLLDKYLMEQVDYRLVDYQNTDRAFDALTDYCTGVEPSNDLEKMMKDKILSMIPLAQTARYKIESLLSERIASSEWITLLSLYFSTIVFLSLFKTTNPLTILVGALVNTAATMLVLNLVKFDTLKYRANRKIWEPIERLFTELDLLPYYPKPTLQEGEAKPKKGQKIRVASYPHLYPNISDKTVEVVTA